MGYNGRAARLQAWLRRKSQRYSFGQGWVAQGGYAGRVVVPASSAPFQVWEAGTESMKQAVCACGNGAQSKIHGYSCLTLHLPPFPPKKKEKKRKKNEKDSRKGEGEIRLRQLQSCPMCN